MKKQCCKKPPCKPLRHQRQHRKGKRKNAAVAVAGGDRGRDRGKNQRWEWMLNWKEMMVMRRRSAALMLRPPSRQRHQSPRPPAQPPSNAVPGDPPNVQLRQPSQSATHRLRCLLHRRNRHQKLHPNPPLRKLRQHRKNGAQPVKLLRLLQKLQLPLNLRQPLRFRWLPNHQSKKKLRQAGKKQQPQRGTMTQPTVR